MRHVDSEEDDDDNCMVVKAAAPDRFGYATGAYLQKAHRSDRRTGSTCVARGKSGSAFVPGEGFPGREIERVADLLHV